MIDNGMSRRLLLKGGAAAAAGLGIAAAGGMGSVPAHAAGDLPIWTINAGGWPLEMAFYRRMPGPRSDLGPTSPTGGFFANVRNAGTGAWEPVLAFQDKEAGLNFCRVILFADGTLEKFQIYRTGAIGPKGPKGYWFEIFPLSSGSNAFRLGSSYPWEVTGGWSPTGGAWNVTIDFEKRWLVNRGSLAAGQKINSWSVYTDDQHPGGTISNFSEYHWYTAGSLRQTWMATNLGGLPTEASAVGWTRAGFSKYGVIASDGRWRNNYWQRPLSFVRALDHRFYKFEYYTGNDNVDCWTNGSNSSTVHWYSDTAGYIGQGYFEDNDHVAVWWRQGTAVRIDAVKLPPLGNDQGQFFSWRTNAYRDTPGSLTNMFDSANYNRLQRP
ncbi:hypothetical protein ACFY3U_16370 [Micromonospora sp. NPDC000089]|uniref:hypothetical protein n=1 Tax=unclassified Micromonospora TaxID=2617518 RepID=UPI0036A1F153